MAGEVSKNYAAHDATAQAASTRGDPLTTPIVNFYDAHRQLSDTVSYLQLIADSLPVLVSFVDADHRYRFVNVGYETWFGRTRADVTGKHLSEVLGDEAYARLRPHIERALSGETAIYEAELPYRYGGKRFVEATYTPQRDDRGRIVGVAALVADISDRKRREQALSALHTENDAARKRAEELYRFAEAVVTAERVEQVFEAALDTIERAMGAPRSSILVFDDAGVMRFRAFRQLSEEYRAAVEGHSPWTRDAVAPQPVLIADALRDPSMAAYRPLFERERIGALAFIPLVASGRLLGKFMVYYDAPHTLSGQELGLATALANHLASAIVRYQAVAKLEDTVRSHELFTGVLAHDLRNPLSAIVTAANLLLMRLEGHGPDVARPLGKIVTSGERMGRMIGQLLDFTRARIGGGFELHRADTNLARLCETAIGEIELAQPKWTITRELRGNLNGDWDADRMLQVISNLVANAGQHGEPGTPITVLADGTHPNGVTLEIHNHGAIPAAAARELFDPFRRAHNRPSHAPGLGLGLFITKEIVQAHGGSVEIESSAQTGETRFKVVLPRTAP